jgi:hypothetical protein
MDPAWRASCDTVVLMTNLVRAFTFALASLAMSCGGSQAASPASTSSSPTTASGSAEDPSCPVAVPGTSVNVEDTETGAALAFVTTGDVAELRARVGRMAQMHNDAHGKMGPLPTGAEGGGHDHAAMGHDHEHAGHAGGMISVHSQAAVEEIEGGARIVYTAGPNDLGALRDELRMHAEHMAAGTCAMGTHE